MEKKKGGGWRIYQYLDNLKRYFLSPPQTFFFCFVYTHSIPLDSTPAFLFRGRGPRVIISRALPRSPSSIDRGGGLHFFEPVLVFRWDDNIQTSMILSPPKKNHKKTKGGICVFLSFFFSLFLFVSYWLEFCFLCPPQNLNTTTPKKPGKRAACFSLLNSYILSFFVSFHLPIAPLLFPSLLHLLGTCTFIAFSFYFPLK